MNDTIWIASYDIGAKNFAFCVEEINLGEMAGISNISKFDRYFSDGTPTPSFANILRKVQQTGKTILIKNIDLTHGCDPKQKLDPKVFINMNACLDQYKNDYWDKCAIFLIEQQMNFGNKRNTMALKLGQHLYSYFTFQYADFKQIIEFPAYHKTQILGARKKMSKPERKNWAVEKGLAILIERNDNEIIKEITSRKKKDDMLDVVCQTQAFKYLAFIDKTI